MAHFSAEQWATVITAAAAALGSLFVSIWNAVHGRVLSEQICRHEQAAAARHCAMVSALAEPPEGDESVGVGA